MAGRGKESEKGGGERRGEGIGLYSFLFLRIRIHGPAAWGTVPVGRLSTNWGRGWENVRIGFLKCS